MSERIPPLQSEKIDDRPYFVDWLQRIWRRADSYIEGTWTPAVTFGGGSTGITYAIQFGQYTRIGRTIHAHCYLQLSDNGSSTGAMAITGLPFASNATTNNYVTCSVWAGSFAASLTTAIQTYVEPGASDVELFRLAAGATAAVVDTDTTNSSQIMLNITYNV